MVAMNTKPRKVIRVTADEFELDNGDIYPHVIELDEDEVPTVEEFQLVRHAIDVAIILCN